MTDIEEDDNIMLLEDSYETFYKEKVLTTIHNHFHKNVSSYWCICICTEKKGAQDINYDSSEACGDSETDDTDITSDTSELIPYDGPSTTSLMDKARDFHEVSKLVERLALLKERPSTLPIGEIFFFFFIFSKTFLNKFFVLISFIIK